MSKTAKILATVFTGIIPPTRIKPHTRIIAQSKIICRNYAPYSNYGPQLIEELRKCGTNRSKSWKKLTILPKRMKQRTKKMNQSFWIVQITNFLYLYTFYFLSQFVKIQTWELQPLLELSPILELRPPSDIEIFIIARGIIPVNTVDSLIFRRGKHNVQY